MADTKLTPFVMRPDVGSSGKKCRLISNHYRLSDIPDTKIYQYAIDIVIEGAVGLRIPTKLARELMNAVQVQLLLKAGRDTFVYDGRALAWSKVKIDDFNIQIPRGKTHVTFTLRYATSFSLGVIKQYLSKKARTSTVVLEAMNFLNHLVSVGPTLSLIPVGRKFFTDLDADCKKFEVIEFRRGVVQAVHFGGETSLTLNVDVTTGIFWNSDCVTVLDLASRFLNIPPAEMTPRRLSAPKLQLLSRALRGVKFHLRHRGEVFAKRLHSIAKVAKKSSKEHVFTMGGDRPRKINVEEYMMSTYNLRLKYPDAVLLIKGDSTFLPMELCYVVSCQRYNRPLDEKQAFEMIKVASSVRLQIFVPRPFFFANVDFQKPAVRQQDIAAKKRILDHDKDPMLKAYGICVNPNMTEVQGRVLPLPQLSFGRGSQSPVMNGEWQSRSAVFKQGVTLKNWGILIFARRNEVHRDLDVFIKTLCQTAQDKGMTIVNRDPMKQFADMNWSGDEITRRLQQDIMPAFNRRGKIELLFVISPAKTSQMYVPVKRYCDTVAGIASQCTHKFNVRRKAQDRGFAFNMLMKINSKLGGVNVSLHDMPLALKNGTVFLGADVTHPSPSSPITVASLATMTGSIDPLACRYAAVASNQTHRVEVITDTESMAKSLLTEYRKETNSLPERIIYLRDGVAEGQFAEVIRVELPAIRAAAKAVAPGKAVKITAIIVQKRHHTRLFPESPQDGDRNGNVQPGTVVDTGIVHPVEFDFFIVPHKAFQGTVRPAHYHVIHDENGFKSDELQTLIYHQSYAFARSSTSVSLHPAVYYAHLAGKRARVRDESMDNDDDAATTVSLGSMKPEDVAITKLKPMHSALNGGALAMWFL